MLVNRSIKAKSLHVLNYLDYYFRIHIQDKIDHGYKDLASDLTISDWNEIGEIWHEHKEAAQDTW